MNKFVYRTGKVTGFGLVGGTVFTGYHYPELRQEPLQLVYAMRRGVRCVFTGACMATDYLRAGDQITSQTHTKAAQRLF